MLRVRGMMLDWKFWLVLGGLAAIAVAAFAVPASPAYYGTDRAIIGEYVPVIHSENGVCITEYASDGLTKKIMDCPAEAGEVVLIQYEPGQGSAVSIDGIAYPATGSGMPVNLVITTHNPPCTAIFMYGHDGVVLRTELRPYPLRGSYTGDEIANGVDVTYAMPAHQADALMPVLAGRPEVLGVASYSVLHPPMLLANAANPDPPASLSDRTRSCSFVQEHLYRMMYDMVLRHSGQSGFMAASERIEPDDILWISIHTSGSSTELSEFLEENGITPFSMSEPTPTRLGGTTVHVPASLLPKLMEVEHVVGMSEVREEINLYVREYFYALEHMLSI